MTGAPAARGQAGACQPPLTRRLPGTMRSSRPARDPARLAPASAESSGELVSAAFHADIACTQGAAQLGHTGANVGAPVALTGRARLVISSPLRASETERHTYLTDSGCHLGGAHHGLPRRLVCDRSASADLVEEANQARDRAQHRPESGTETPVGLAIMLTRVVGWLGPPSRRCPPPAKARSAARSKRRGEEAALLRVAVSFRRPGAERAIA